MSTIREKEYMYDFNAENRASQLCLQVTVIGGQRGGKLIRVGPLWQNVSLLSSPVLILATHKSLLLMKAMKSGLAGQIFGSMRVPEH